MVCESESGGHPTSSNPVLGMGSGGSVSPKRGFPKMPCENVPRQHLKGFILETRNFVIFSMSTIGLKQMDMFGLGRSWFSSRGSTEQGLRQLISGYRGPALREV